MVNFRTPISLLPEELDLYLEHGWYRMGQRIFTVDYIFISEWIRVFWLRFRMDRFEFGKKQNQLISRNSRFQTAVLPLKMTLEIEELYALYRKSIDFEASNSASELLFDEVYTGEILHNVYDSYMIQVRDGQKLIAVGVFDLGKETMAGIVNFYHPEYKKFSLGKFLILKKMEYAIGQNLPWYYPGYIGHNLSKFDYKLDPGIEAAEILEPFDGIWLAYKAGLVEEITENQRSLFFPEEEDDDNDLDLENFDGDVKKLR